MRWTEVPAGAWRTPQELVPGTWPWRRSSPATPKPPTPAVGRPTPLAAIWPNPTWPRSSQAALALGWTLWRYEADIDHAPAALVEQGLMSEAFTNWRELEQVRNLAAVLAGLAASDRLLVWVRQRPRLPDRRLLVGPVPSPPGPDYRS